jgi:hypothetical protein
VPTTSLERCSFDRSEIGCPAEIVTYGQRNLNAVITTDHELSRRLTGEVRK